MARGLTGAERQALTGFFTPKLLAAVRLRWMARGGLPGFAAITFGRRVFISRRELGAGVPPTDLLFHELVHVVQYQLLGFWPFLWSYGAAFVRLRGDYFRIPHERIANELRQRFRANPATPFAVRDTIQAWVNGGCR